jgi:hypothetical protein
MNYRYKIRMFESGDADSSVEAGTIVLPIDRGFSVFAASGEEAERRVSKDVTEGKLAKGRIYQICPEVGNPELIRSIAVGTDCVAMRVFLDPAKGLYSEFRRLRYAENHELPTEDVVKVASGNPVLA